MGVGRVPCCPPPNPGDTPGCSSGGSGREDGDPHHYHQPQMGWGTQGWDTDERCHHPQLLLPLRGVANSCPHFGHKLLGEGKLAQHRVQATGELGHAGAPLCHLHHRRG